MAGILYHFRYASLTCFGSSVKLQSLVSPTAFLQTIKDSESFSYVMVFWGTIKPSISSDATSILGYVYSSVKLLTNMSIK